MLRHMVPALIGGVCVGSRRRSRRAAARSRLRHHRHRRRRVARAAPRLGVARRVRGRARRRRRRRHRRRSRRAIAGPTASWPLALAAGLLVGFGARYGGGCTSGHGVCGVGRLSRRSIVGCATFVAVAMLVVFVVRHAGVARDRGRSSASAPDCSSAPAWSIARATDPAVVLGFLDVAGAWNPSLLRADGRRRGDVRRCSTGSRVAAAARSRHRRCGSRTSGRSTRACSSAPRLFGLGWGLVGLCPGPAVTALFGGNGSGRVFVAAMLAGIAVAPRSASRAN